MSSIYSVKSKQLNLGLNVIGTDTNQLRDPQNYGYHANVDNFRHFILHPFSPTMGGSLWGLLSDCKSYMYKVWLNLLQASKVMLEHTHARAQLYYIEII